MEARTMTRPYFLMGLIGLVLEGCGIAEPDIENVPKLNPKWAVWGRVEKNETLYETMKSAGHGPYTKPTKHGEYLTGLETYSGSDWVFTLVNPQGTAQNLEKGVTKMELGPGWIWGGWPLVAA